jgi:hypothetical protein
MIEKPHLSPTPGTTASKAPHSSFSTGHRALISFVLVGLSSCVIPEQDSDHSEAVSPHMTPDEEQNTVPTVVTSDDDSHSFESTESRALLQTHQASSFPELHYSLLNDPWTEGPVRSTIMNRLNLADEAQAQRISARLEIAYCLMNSVLHKQTLKGWREYEQYKFERVMFYRTDALVHAGVPIVLRSITQLSAVPDDFNEMNGINRVFFLTQRLDEIEYAYLLACIIRMPHDEDHSRIIQSWHDLRIQALSQLQNELSNLVLSGQLQNRQPRSVPYHK